MKRRLLPLCALMLLLTGCQERMIEEQALVVSMGVDVVEGGMRLCVKVPSNAPASSGGGSGGSGGSDGQSQDEGYILLMAVGEDWENTLSLMHATVPRTLNFSQLREIVLGEKLSESPKFLQVLRNLYMLPRIRQAATLVSCKGEALEFIKVQKAYLGIRLGQYLDVTLDNYAGKGFIPVTTLGDTVRDFGRGWRDPLLVYAAVNDFKEQKPLPGDNPVEAVAGSLPRESINKNEFVGAAATDGVCVSGLLTGYDMQLLSLIGGGVQSLVIRWDSEYLIVRSRLPARIAYDGEGGGTLRLVAHVILEYKAGQPKPDDSAVRELERDLERLIRKLQGFRCDAMGFGAHAVRKFSTLEEWERYHFRERYATADISVTVSARLQEVN